MELRINIDGGARGNPGPAGAGVVLRSADGSALLEAGYYLGRATNNVAEYTALLRALEAAERLGAQRLEILSDSELMVRQINGEYRVRNESLKGLYADAFERLQRFTDWRVRHVRREDNARADQLANLAMDAARDVIVVENTTDGNDAAKRRPSVGARPASAADGRRRASGVEAATITVVRCIQAPQGDICPAPCKIDAEYEFSSVTPDGICIHVASAMLQAVLADSASRGEKSFVCPHRDCKARFEVT